MRESQGSLVGGPGFFNSAQSSQQFAPRRVSELIISQIAAREDRVDERKARRRAVTHRDGGGTIQLDNRRGVGPNKNVVEAHDLRPIGRVRRCGFGVHRGDRRLQRIGPEPPARRARARRATRLPQSIRDSRAIDPGPTADQFAVLRRARRAPRLLKQHQRQQANRFRFRQQFSEQPSQTNRFGRQVVAGKRGAGRSE